jgi:uncharacterized RDD family membrane protein YckC
MKIAVRKLRLLVLWLVAVVLVTCGGSAPGASSAPASPPPPGGARDLLTHGTDRDYWAANVAPDPDPRVTGAVTSIRRRAPGDAQWHEIAQLATGATALGNRGNELLVVQAGGQWSIISTSSDPSEDAAEVRTGAPLPGRAEVRELAGGREGGDDVWAVAVAPAGKTLPATPATTSAATAATTAATAATKPASGPTAEAPPAAASSGSAASSRQPPTRPALPPHDAGLFRLHLGKWSEVDVLPGSPRRDDIRAVSLMVFERRLMLAIATGLEVRVFTRGPGDEDEWDAGTRVAVLSDGGELRLLDVGGRPVLWMSDPAGPGTIFVHAPPRWGSAVKLASSPRLANYDRRSLVVALGRLRLLASDARGRLAEQFYKLDGALDGQAAEAVTIPRGNDERLGEFLEVLIAVVLVVWFIGSYQQRPALRDAMARVDRLSLAPLSRRLVGGLIDLAPLVGGFVAANVVFARSGQKFAAHLTIDSPEFAFICAGLATYLLLATVMELLTGRSLGKLVAGTKVAALDGRRPIASAVLIRNLLRIADLAVFPLGFILLSPLRQRLGDMAAGTIVVRSDAPEPAAAAAADDASADTSSDAPTDENS